MNKVMRTIQFSNRFDFDSINTVNLDGGMYNVNLIIKVYDPENQITNLNQILAKMLMWRTQDGEMLMKDYILNQPISANIKIPIYSRMIDQPRTLEIEFKEKPYDTAEILDAYILID